MDNSSIPKLDKRSIYEIYRACRLCGAGAGYKMPIIQNVVDLDSNEVELQQKIRDCVQIEVNSDDKMPPLICELCVDKVNDFYEFMEMCQQTNKKTRTRLGLPLQTSSKVRSKNYESDCILGVTEQVYGNEDSDEPLSTSKRPKAEPKVKIKVEKDLKKPSDNTKVSRPENKSRTENSRDSRSRVENSRDSRSRNENSRDSRSRNENSRDSRSRNENSRDSRSCNENSREFRSRNENGRESRVRGNAKETPSGTSSRESSESRLSDSPRVTRLKRPPTPPRVTRNAKVTQEENVSLSTLKQQVKKSPPAPKSILKKVAVDETKAKRPREPPKPEVPPKKVKLAATFPCSVCRRTHNTSQALGNHMRSHVVTYTQTRLSCNACRLWFASAEEAAAHHRVHKARHKPYRCRRCEASYKLQQAFDDHITNNECLPWEEVPDVKCPVCWRLFPTNNLLDQHRCGGVDSRPGGKCMKCKRTYALLKNLTKHEETCTAKRKSNPIIDPEVERRLLPMRVRLVRCDSLLRDTCGSCDVSAVTQGFGLDPSSSYPYLRRSPALPRDRMVSIKADIHDLHDMDDTDDVDDVGDFVHWDSDDSDVDAGTVDSLLTLSLKKIFSRQLLGKVPRKRRKVKIEKDAFDSLMNASEFDMSKDIHSIIENLDDDDINFDNKTSDVNDNDSLNSESLLCDNDVAVDISDKKNDFDNYDNDSQSLFNNVEEQNTDRVSISKLEKDKDNISTDCETDAEDVKEDECKETRLSNENSSKTDFKDSNEEIHCNDSSTDNNVHLSKDTEKDSNNIDDSNKTERWTNGEVNEKFENLSSEDVNETEDDMKLMNDLDEQIGESNDKIYENNDKVNDESALENHNTNDDKEANESNSKETTEFQSNELENYKNNLTNEQINDGTVNKALSSNNDEIVNSKMPVTNTDSLENHNTNDDKEANESDIKETLTDFQSNELENYKNNLTDEPIYDGTVNEALTSNNDEIVNSKKSEIHTEAHDTTMTNDDDSTDKQIPEINDYKSIENDEISMANNVSEIHENNDNRYTENHDTNNDFTNKEKHDFNDVKSSEYSSISNEKNKVAIESNDKTTNLESEIDPRDENEAICNDIENKINDLIALRNHTENNDWGHSVNNDRGNEDSHNVSSHSRDSGSFAQNNDFDKGKISLDDLLPAKDSNLKSMDLDSISDEDFDFDA